MRVSMLGKGWPMIVDIEADSESMFRFAKDQLRPCIVGLGGL